MRLRNGCERSKSWDLNHLSPVFNRKGETLDASSPSPKCAAEIRIESAHESAIPIAVPARLTMCPFEPKQDQRFNALRPDPNEGARDVLPRLVEGDPLELLPRCAAHLAREALLLDLSRLHARCLALVARRIEEVIAEDSDEWLNDRVDEAANQLIHEEQFEERLGYPPPRSMDPRSSLLVGALGIEPALTRGVSVNFHHMAREDRRTFWRAVVAGEPISGIAEDDGDTRDGVLEILRGVIRSMSLCGLPENRHQKNPNSESERDTP